MDHIKVYVSGNDKVADIMRKNEAYICEEVLAEAVVYGEANEQAKAWKLNGEDVTLGVEKL